MACTNPAVVAVFARALTTFSQSVSSQVLPASAVAEVLSSSDMLFALMRLLKLPDGAAAAVCMAWHAAWAGYSGVAPLAFASSCAPHTSCNVDRHG